MPNKWPYIKDYVEMNFEDTQLYFLKIQGYAMAGVQIAVGSCDSKARHLPNLAQG